MRYETIDVGVCYHDNVSITFDDDTSEATAMCSLKENTECISELAAIISKWDHGAQSYVEINQHISLATWKIKPDTYIQTPYGDGAHGAITMQNQLELKWAATLYKRFSLSARYVFNDVDVSYLDYEGKSLSSIWFRSVTVEPQGVIHAVE